jgi:hypothetical protein
VSVDLRMPSTARSPKRGGEKGKERNYLEILFIESHSYFLNCNLFIYFSQYIFSSRNSFSFFNFCFLFIYRVALFSCLFDSVHSCGLFRDSFFCILSLSMNRLSFSTFNTILHNQGKIEGEKEKLFTSFNPSE